MCSTGLTWWLQAIKAIPFHLMLNRPQTHPFVFSIVFLTSILGFHIVRYCRKWLFQMLVQCRVHKTGNIGFYGNLSSVMVRIQSANLAYPWWEHSSWLGRNPAACPGACPRVQDIKVQFRARATGQGAPQCGCRQSLQIGAVNSSPQMLWYVICVSNQHLPKNTIQP